MGFITGLVLGVAVGYYVKAYGLRAAVDMLKRKLGLGPPPT